MPGKTPGRERKPAGYQTIKNSPNMKQLSYKNPSTGFGFDPAVSAPKNNHVSFLPQATANIWTESRATFSDVVAQQPMFPVGQSEKQVKIMQNSYLEQQKQQERRSAGDVQGMSNLGGNIFHNRRNNCMYGGRVKNDLSLYGSMDVGKPVNKRNSDDFGPIGPPLITRHSPPLFQQNWEPIEQPTPMHNYYQTQGSSPFLDTFQNRNSIQQHDSVGNIGQQKDNGILKAANLMSHYPFWNADRNVLMEMFNRQQQQEQLDAWNRTTAWNPMNYTNTPAASSTNTQYQLNTDWPISGRPPPGLSLNRVRQQQQHMGGISVQHQGPHISNNQSEEANITTISAGNMSGGAIHGEPMRTYDPFKSLSYLWQGSTDLWGSSGNNNNKKQE